MIDGEWTWGGRNASQISHICVQRTGKFTKRESVELEALVRSFSDLIEPPDRGRLPYVEGWMKTDNLIPAAVFFPLIQDCTLHLFTVPFW